MTAGRSQNQYYFNCDRCSEYIETGERTFEEGWAHAREEGWRALKLGPVWVHHCPTCVEDAKHDE